MSVLEFVLARLAEDEAVAQAVPSWGDPGSADPFIRHICRHFPDRVIRSVAAVRLSLVSLDDEQLQAWAHVWSDHPDFDSEWA